MNYHFADYFAPAAVCLFLITTLNLLLNKNAKKFLGSIELSNSIVFALLLIPTFFQFDKAPRQLILSDWLPDSFEDGSKRNENWSWIVSEEYSDGMWVPRGNKNTIESGAFTNFYSSGKIYEKGMLANFQFTDTRFIYDTSGSINQHLIYTADSTFQYFPINGDFVGYYIDESLFQKGIVKHHKRSRTWQEYYRNGILKLKNYPSADSAIEETYYENGKIKSINTYYNQKHTGTSSSFFTNGQLKKTALYTNDKLEGLHSEWHENGEKKHEVFYRKGMLHGPGQGWYKNKRVKFTGSFFYDKKDGDFEIFFENGQLRQKATYVKASVEGEAITYEENGGYKIVNFKNDLMNGSFKQYNSLGVLEKDDYYENGYQIEI